MLEAVYCYIYKLSNTNNMQEILKNSDIVNHCTNAIEWAISKYFHNDLINMLLLQEKLSYRKGGQIASLR